jgi:hypothetical protein
MAAAVAVSGWPFTLTVTAWDISAMQSRGNVECNLPTASRAFSSTDGLQESA